MIKRTIQEKNDQTNNTGKDDQRSKISQLGQSLIKLLRAKDQTDNESSKRQSEMDDKQFQTCHCR